MKYIQFLALILIAAGTSCHTNENKVQEAPTWSALTITSEDRDVITINNQDDTTTIKHYSGGSFFGRAHALKIDSLKTYFTMAEKDTLYNIVEGIISNPVKPKGSCTEFVGELKLVVDYSRGGFREPGSFRQSIEYSGVCYWKFLSPKTSRLYRILKTRIKWWQNDEK